MQKGVNMMSSLRKQILTELAHCDKEIMRIKTEIEFRSGELSCYNDRKVMLNDLLTKYDREHPDERKEGENNAAD